LLTYLKISNEFNFKICLFFNLTNCCLFFRLFVFQMSFWKTVKSTILFD